MLPRLRLLIATLAAVFVAAAALSVLSTSRSVSHFALGPRTATGSPLEYALPEPPNWRQSVALAASRRAEELNRLLDLVDTAPAAETSEPAPGDQPATTVAPSRDSETSATERDATAE
jgi:hypothetical protein